MTAIMIFTPLTCRSSALKLIHTTCVFSRVQQVCSSPGYQTLRTLSTSNRVVSTKNIKNSSLQKQQLLDNTYQITFGDLLNKDPQEISILQRHFCTEKETAVETNSNTQDPLESDNFILIYRFPFIVHARLVSRFKVYHTAFTFFLIPFVTYLNYTGHASNLAVYTSAGIFTVAGIMLYVVSSFIRRIVGMLYIDKNRQIVKLAHLTFWSKRKTVLYKLSEIQPISDTAENPTDLYVKLKTYTGDKYFLTLKYGQVLQKQDFQEVIGRL